MRYEQYIFLIPLLPLLAFALLGLWGKSFFRQYAGIFSTLLMAVVTVLSLYAAFNYFLVNGKAGGVYQSLIPFNYNWLNFSQGMSINMGILLDPISVMMLVVVSIVSLMVNIFSLDYMKGEERFGVYFAFLSLFSFSMFGLVLSTNIFQIYIFWELVGISSYLLIGFYFEKPSAVAAAKKAFIVTRFADLGFLIGILIVAFYGGSLDFNTLLARLGNASSPQSLSITTASFMGLSALTWSLVLVFAGGAGKSAMFPLHIWLPDAMEGPTPVSALIHAATMVVAGVFLVARLFPLYLFNGASQQVVVVIGTLSSLLAAIIACTQTDIKRILAYSTMSQIGYMMLALGVSGYVGEAGLGYSASLFHLFTHAFFKSLLFLCAGSIIHFVHSNEMKDMGGLAKMMPLTHLCFLVACLSIAGLPPFSGFFSKEEILAAAFAKHKFVYAVALFTAGLTAFYMFRLYFSVFWKNKNRLYAHRADTGPMMKVAMVSLAILTLVSGFVPFTQFVTADGKPFTSHGDLAFSIGPVAIAIFGLFIAARLYYTDNNRAEKWSQSWRFLYRTALHKFYIDEIYLFITRKIIFNGVGRPAAWIDKHLVDGFMNQLAAQTEHFSVRIKGLQSGKLQSYALYFFAGLAGLTLILLYFWK